MPRITDLSLKNATPPAQGRITLWDGALGVRITANGTKTFITMLGSGKRHTIGRYPTITLAAARTAAQRLRAEKQLGRIFPETVTLKDAKEQYLTDAELRPATLDYTKRNLNRLSATKLTDIAPKDVNRILEKLGPSSRAQCLRVYSAFFNWCLRKHYLDRSPVERMQAGQSTSRDRVLSDQEIGKIWKWAAEHPTTSFGRIVRVLILTGQRRGEIAALQTSWLNEKEQTITIPKEIAKNGREHTFPIGKSAISTLSADPSSDRLSKNTLLFPARGKPNAPFNGWSKSKAALDKLSGVTGWTLHDLRRTFATRLAEMGVAPHIIERLLNHVSGTISGVAATYNRAKYLPEMRDAIDLWEAHIKRITAA